MSKQIVKTDNAPSPVGPYSQANVVNGMVFTAGQLGMKPGETSLVLGGIAAETRQALMNLQAVLEAAGSSLEKVVKVTVFLDNIEDFAEMNTVYGEYFTQNPPARSAFEVARLPLSAKVEIEAVASID